VVRDPDLLGHENKVQRLIQRRIDEEPGEPEEKQIQDVQVPTQEVVELRNGKRVTSPAASIRATSW
jgi:transcription termination/antitermination protein NusG